MSVVFFRNMLDANMKRFGKFSKTIVGNIGSTHSLHLVYSVKRRDYLERFNFDDTFIIIAHGSSDEIYHRFKSVKAKHQNLIDISQNTYSKRKPMGKIIAISCGTAKVLGEHLVLNGNCKVYLGFKTKLHFDKKQSISQFVSPYYSRELKEIYKEVFEQVLTKAIQFTWTFEKLARVLDFELRKSAAERVRKIKKCYPHYYKVKEINQILVAVSSVADGITVIGNEKEVVR